MASTRSARRTAATAATIAIGGLLGACGDADDTRSVSAASAAAVATYFESLSGGAHADYIDDYATLEAASADADLIVVGRIAGAVPGPTFGPPDVIAQGGGFPSTSVTVLVDRVVAGSDPGPTVDFLTVTGAGDDPVAEVAPPTGRVLLMLSDMGDGTYEFLGPHGLLVESAGSVTAPLLVRDPSDSYVQQLGTKTSLDQVAALLGG